MEVISKKPFDILNRHPEPRIVYTLPMYIKHANIDDTLISPYLGSPMIGFLSIFQNIINANYVLEMRGKLNRATNKQTSFYYPYILMLF